MPVIFHITRTSDWQSSVIAGSYTADSLTTEGFIHCSTAQQVIATANRIFRGKRDLVLLCVDTDEVEPEIRYENLEGGTDLFPHVYGALEITSVTAVHEFPPRADGTFELPPPLRGT